MYMDNLKVLGFKGEIDSVNVTLDLINSIKKDGEIIQLLNADQAYLAFERGENLAKDISVEIVLRCSAQRQISKAFNILGLKEGPMNLCAVLINCDYSDELSDIFTLDNSVLIPDVDKLKKVYNINDFELEKMSVEDIIVDRITKLTVDY